MPESSMSDHSRITVLLGAGATLEIGAPSTGGLTEAVRLLKNESPDVFPQSSDRQREIMLSLFETLEPFYHSRCRKESVNFEDVFHAIEQLVSLHAARQYGTVKAFKPVLAAFTTDDKWLDTVEEPKLFGLLNLIRHIIGDRIHQCCEGFAANSGAAWFRDFWQGLGSRFTLDIATLNYDNLFEQIFAAEDLSDGYINNHTYAWRFSPEVLLNAKRHRLMHLHGSILFGSPHPVRQAPPDPMRDFHSLVKFSDYKTAREAWGVLSTENHAQSGDMAAVGPLVTGHRKTDKLLSAPYIDYNHQLYESLRQNERLLIIGYGFGDYHINALLRRLKAWHGDRSRVVVVDYVDEFHRSTWSPFNNHFDWAPINLLWFLAAVTGESQPFPSHEYKNPIPLGKHQRGLMFLEGFENAARHSDLIADFFSR